MTEDGHNAKPAKQQLPPGIAYDHQAGESVLVPTSPSPADEAMAAEQGSRPDDPEEAIIRTVLMPFVGWLLDADGRGAFNPEAIASRVAALAWVLDPSLVHGVSERQLAARLGVDKSKLSRAVGDVVEQLGVSNASTSELRRAAKKTARRFAKITRPKKRHETRRASVTPISS